MITTFKNSGDHSSQCKRYTDHWSDTKLPEQKTAMEYRFVL